MKRLSALFALLFALLLLSACGSNPIPTPSPAPAAVNAPPAAVEAAAPTAEPTLEPEPSRPEPSPAPAYDTAAYEAAVEALLQEYRILRTTEPGEFREEEHPEIPWYSVSHYLIYQFDGVGLYAGRYDFDGNGVPELVLATGDGTYYYPIGVYAFDGAALRYLCKEQALGERCSLSVSEDGTFTVSGSGGAASGVVLVYRIAPDGFSAQILDWYEYQFQSDGSAAISCHVGEMDAERFDPERLFQPFDTPIDFTLVP